MSPSTSAQAATPATGQPASAEPQCNIAQHLSRRAAELPDKPAVVCPAPGSTLERRAYTHLTFAQLESRSNQIAAGLRRIGIQRGMRTIVMVRPGLDFFAITFALFKLCALPVLIDPGMGRRNLAKCLREVDAEAFIGIPLAHVLRLMNPRSFARVQIKVTVGRRWGWGGQTLADLLASAPGDFTTEIARPDDPAAILFTSGSTGPAKGVLYTHGNFEAQIRYLNDFYGYRADEVDLATFPLFALFDAALGMTAVIPQMDASRPGSADPRHIIAAIRDHGCTHMFGSPALLGNLARHCDLERQKLPSLRRIITAGAPVRAATLALLRRAISSECDIHTPYGATEALPIADIESRRVLDETRFHTALGAGTCVGFPLSGIDVRIIAVTDGPILHIADARPLRAGEIGEIIVRGDVVTRQYVTQPDANRLSKIADADGTFWHRMGDTGYLDDHGSLWFCGRKSQRVRPAGETLFTDPVEGVFHEHPRVYRCALVGVGTVGDQRPVLCVELHAGDPGDRLDELTQELTEMASAHESTRDVRTFLFPGRFPVDVRHNAKIAREQLAAWAARRLQHAR